MRHVWECQSVSCTNAQSHCNFWINYVFKRQDNLHHEPWCRVEFWAWFSSRWGIFSRTSKIHSRSHSCDVSRNRRNICDNTRRTNLTNNRFVMFTNPRWYRNTDIQAAHSLERDRSSNYIEAMICLFKRTIGHCHWSGWSEMETKLRIMGANQGTGGHVPPNVSQIRENTKIPY